MARSSQPELPRVPWDELCQLAKEARRLAYAPYSHFQVGAAIWCPDGTIWRGANIENASLGLTICAERVAIGALLMSGRRSFQAVAVASDGGVAPCGACRQVLAEFADQAIVALTDAASTAEPRMVTLAELLPFQFFLDARRPEEP